MARRRRAEKKPPEPDVRYNSTLVSYIIRTVMKRGKRSVAEGIVYGAMDLMQDKMGQDSLEILKQAIDNIKPKLEVKSRRVGGATYQVPMEVGPERQIALAVRWITQYANGRRSVPMREALAYELMDAYNNQGSAVKKRDDTHKMAHANKAFAHYRW